jgi:hypothetical protein
MKNKITLIEYISYTPLNGYVWHRRSGIDTVLKYATRPKEAVTILKERLKKDNVKYDKLIVKWR